MDTWQAINQAGDALGLVAEGGGDVLRAFLPTAMCLSQPTNWPKSTKQYSSTSSCLKLTAFHSVSQDMQTGVSSGKLQTNVWQNNKVQGKTQFSPSDRAGSVHWGFVINVGWNIILLQAARPHRLCRFHCSTVPVFTSPCAEQALGVIGHQKSKGSEAISLLAFTNQPTTNTLGVKGIYRARFTQQRYVIQIWSAPVTDCIRWASNL